MFSFYSQLLRLTGLEFDFFYSTMFDIFSRVHRTLHSALSVRPSVGRSVSMSRKVWKRAFPPLPTRPQLVLAVYPALFRLVSESVLSSSMFTFLFGVERKTNKKLAFEAPLHIKLGNVKLLGFQCWVWKATAYWSISYHINHFTVKSHSNVFRGTNKLQLL